MTIEEYIKRYYPRGFYPDGEPLPGRREEFNRRNSVYLVNGIKPDVVFIGDSIIDWWEIQPYFSALGKVVNRGIGGEMTYQLVERFKQDAIDLQPKAIVVLEGINDFYPFFADKNNRPNPEETEEIIKKTVNNHETFMRTSKDAGIEHIVCSILPIGCLDERNGAIIEMNGRIKALTEKYGCYYADLYGGLVEDDGLRLKQVHFGDELHPHVIGYNIMAERLMPILKKILKKLEG